MFRAEILASFVTAVFFLCTSFWAKSCPLNMACAWRKNALPNCLLGNEGSYLSLSHWYCNFTLSSLAVELLLVIYDMHVSFSLVFPVWVAWWRRERKGCLSKGNGGRRWRGLLCPQQTVLLLCPVPLPSPTWCRVLLTLSLQWDQDHYSCYHKAIHTSIGEETGLERRKYPPVRNTLICFAILMRPKLRTYCWWAKLLLKQKTSDVVIVEWKLSLAKQGSGSLLTYDFQQLGTSTLCLNNAVSW